MLRSVKISHYLAVMAALGLERAALLEGSGIDPAVLGQPSGVIEFRQAKRVVANMIRLSGNQGIGFEVARELRIADLGILGHALMSARSVWHAIDLVARYGGTVAGLLIRIELDEDEHGHWGLSIRETEPLGFLYNFCVEEALVMIARLGSQLVGQPLQLRSISLSYPAPSHQALYRQAFDCPVEFNADSTRITFTSLSLHEPVKTNDEELNALILGHCQHIQRQLASDGPLAARLRGLLLRQAKPLPSLTEAAQLLDMSPRKLRRQLDKEDISYRELVTELRIDLAKEYLASQRFAPKEVSYLLGFKDVNAFRRAFRSWTGLTVGEFQAGSVAGAQ